MGRSNNDKIEVIIIIVKSSAVKWSGDCKGLNVVWKEPKEKMKALQKFHASGHHRPARAFNIPEDQNK